MKLSSSIARYGGFVFSVGGARVVGILITSATFPYLVRHLGVEMYGLWSYVVAVCAFLDVIANPGLSIYTTQQVAARREAAADLLPDVLTLRVLSSLLAGAALLVVASLETRLDVRQLFYWYGLGILVVNLTSTEYLMTGLEMFHASSLFTIVQQCLYALGIFTLVRSPKDVVWVPGSILISAAMIRIGGWFLLWRRGFHLSFAIRPDRWKGILVPGAHYAVATLMSSLYHRTGHIVVRWFLGEHALGLYAAATRLVDILRHFVLIVMNVLMPRMALAAKAGAGLERLARLAIALVAVVSIPLTLGLMSTAAMVVPWVMGFKYVETATLVRWMAPYMITSSLASLLSGTILYAMGKHRSYLAATSAGAIAGVLLYLVLTYAFGLIGAGLAFALAEFVVAATAFALLPWDIRSLWRTPVIGIALLSGFLMVVIVRIMNDYSVRPVIVICVGALVYVNLCGWFSRRWFARELGDSAVARPVSS